MRRGRGKQVKEDKGNERTHPKNTSLPFSSSSTSLLRHAAARTHKPSHFLSRTFYTSTNALAETVVKVVRLLNWCYQYDFLQLIHTANNKSSHSIKSLSSTPGMTMTMTHARLHNKSDGNMEFLFAPLQYYVSFFRSSALKLLIYINAHENSSGNW